MMKRKRSDVLKSCTRAGIAFGLLGLCGMLALRDEKIQCNQRCGRCDKNVNGNCLLGLK